MNTSLTTTRSTQIAATSLPAMSTRLQIALRAIEREAAIERDYPMAPEPLPAAVKDEAADALAAYEILLARKVTEKALGVWLLPIVEGMANAKAEVLMRALPSFHMACEMIPGIALTREAQREASQLWKFIPSAADIYELLYRHTKPLYATRAALARAAAAPVMKQQDEASEPLTDDERARIAQRLADLSAELTKMTALPPEQRPQPRHLTDEQLLPVYEQRAKEGSAIAAFSAARLRDKIARANAIGGKF